MTKKMLLNVVVSNISDIDVSKYDPFEKSYVTIELENGVILRAQEKFKNEEINEEINFLLDKNLLNKEIFLIFRGKQKIRFDVLKKLKSMADLFISLQQYPYFKKQIILIHVKNVLGEPDPRVLNWYVDCIEQCIYSGTGKKLSYYENRDVSYFVNAVDSKISGENS